MQRKIIYLINPISGGKSKEQLLLLINQETKQRGFFFEILSTRQDGNYHFLKEKIQQEKITDIVICGGDGTISQVTSVLIDIAVNVGIIPMGSGNGLAYAAKIPKQPAEALNLIFNGHAYYIDSFYINNNFSCMLCGLGFDAQVAHNFSKKKKRGLLTYIKETAAHFFVARPYPFVIINQEKTFSTEAFFISIANSNQFGNQFTIAPQASLNDGLLDIVVVKKMSKLRMMFALLLQMKTGKINDHEAPAFHKKDVLYFQTNQLTILNNGLAPLHVDGDPAATANTFVIKVMPKAFRLIQPN